MASDLTRVHVLCLSFTCVTPQSTLTLFANPGHAKESVFQSNLYPPLVWSVCDYRRRKSERFPVESEKRTLWILQSF